MSRLSEMQAEAIKFDEVSNIEIGAEGVRVTLHNGERKFIGGEIGFELYQKWIKHVENGDRRGCDCGEGSGRKRGRGC